MNPLNLVSKQSQKPLLIMVSLAIAMLAVLDVGVIGKLSLISNSPKKNELLFFIIVTLSLRSLANILLVHIQSKICFDIYKQIVLDRFLDMINKGNNFERSTLVNYVANESLQVVLNVLMPALIMLSHILQVLILIVGAIYIVGKLFLYIALPIVFVYLLYLIPVQLILNKRGSDRKIAEDLRSDFLNNAVNSIEELKHFDKSKEIINRYIKEPTKNIYKGLTLKWANAESQKNILELCVLLGLTLWYFLFSPGFDEFSKLSGSLFLFYRIAPMITRIAVAYQSFIYGRPSMDTPASSKKFFSYNVDCNGEYLTISNAQNCYNLPFKEPGIYLIVGSSGVGKSTVLSMIADVLSNRGIKLGFVGQKPLVLSGNLSDNLLSGKKLPSSLIDNFKLNDIASREHVLTSTSVSGGEAMRIALLRNIISNPKVLLLDEPFASLDSENKFLLSKVLNNFSSKRAIFCVAHDIPESLEVKNVIQL